MFKLAVKIVAFLILSVAAVQAQNVKVEAVLDTSRLRIGEQANVDIYVTYDASKGAVNINWPSVGDTLTSKIEVIEVSPIDTTLPNKTNSTLVHQHQRITISVYDSGFYAVPPLKFLVNNGSDSLYTSPLFFEVHTLPVDTAQNSYKDIKRPFDEPFNWKWYLPSIIGSAITLLAIALAIWVFRKYFRNSTTTEPEPEKPKVPAHITALTQLERIQSESIWKEGKVKEYYSEISDVIRAYIENRFGVYALESTTDEIMSAFKMVVADNESKEKLRQLLSLADLVKFAKMTPLDNEHNLSIQHAFDFVNGTKREEQENETSTNEGESNA